MSVCFAELNLSQNILKSIAHMGFVEASPIQEMAIPHIMQGCDMVGQAQTGTGKTAAFAIPLLERLDLTQRHIQALIMCPTRELAIQVAGEISKLAAHQPSLGIVPIYGGQSIELQLRALRKQPRVIVGTPGRIMDHMQRGTVSLDQVNMVVLDEADEMLNMGFREDIEFILQATPSASQRLLFSATMPQEIIRLSAKFLRNPQMVKVARKTMTVEGIEQSYFEVQAEDKKQSLCRLLEFENFAKALVFCSTRQGADETSAFLQNQGIKADALHGNLLQAQRDRVMQRFRSGQVNILVATDVAARGLDVNDVDAVINFDLPGDAESYVHRIGRTGRAGRSGRSFTFTTNREYFRMRQIMRQTKANISKGELPQVKDLIELKGKRILEQAELMLNSHNLQILQPLLAEYEDNSTLLPGLLALMLQKDFKELANEQRKKQEQKLAPKQQVAMSGKKVRLHFNVGRKLKVAQRDLVGAIAGETGFPSKMIGSITVHDSFSLVDVEQGIAGQVMDIMNKCQIRGVRVKVRLDDYLPGHKPAPKFTAKQHKRPENKRTRH